MYGWRGRIGLVVPANNTVIEPDVYRHLPDGVTVSAAQMDVEGGSESGFEDQEREIERCGRTLRDARIDVAVYGVTTGSLVKGPGYEREIERLLGGAAGVPAVATAASVLRAFDALGIDSVAIATPYIDELNEREEEFLVESGYEVVDVRGLGHDSVHAIGELSPETAYREAKDLDHDSADAVFVSCTNWRTFEAIEPLEADLGKPVVSSNQVTLWDALRTIDVDPPAAAPGSLFDY